MTRLRGSRWTGTRVAFGTCFTVLVLVGTACGHSASGKPYAIPPQRPDRPVHAAYEAVPLGYPPDIEPFGYGIQWSPADGTTLLLSAAPDDRAGAAEFIGHTTIDTTLDRIGRFSAADVGCTGGRPSISAHRDGWAFAIELAPRVGESADICQRDDATRQTLTDAMASLRVTDFHGWLTYAEAGRVGS